MYHARGLRVGLEQKRTARWRWTRKRRRSLPPPSVSLSLSLSLSSALADEATAGAVAWAMP